MSFEKRSGLMVSVLGPGASDLGSSPGRGHCSWAKHLKGGFQGSAHVSKSTLLL